MHGIDSSKIEVTNISPHGLWLIVNEVEHFLPYEEFPWFKNSAASKIFNIELHHEDHLYWPELDVDLHLESLDNLEKYPLISII
ncbi:MAG: DUF2442 domain-containing protein [Melioribacteraceae bacterium]|nr:DUF2442 domain-containing protein [Melioribacteraceae bacterium]MCF8265584.1 DUF2442 domain-containing protein [Melioribacteraceae bacterium]MCF8431529.1 DUF2442 domain-containing protein [Melioribacteraceae bacterium]